MVEARMRHLGADEPAYAARARDLALYLPRSGEVEQALAINRRTLEARTSTLGERDRTLDSVANMAQCRRSGLPAEALR